MMDLPRQGGPWRSLYGRISSRPLRVILNDATGLP
jgi:hypothetical protein